MALILSNIPLLEEDLKTKVKKLLLEVKQSFNKKTTHLDIFVNPGEGFGEQSIINNVKRIMTFKCIQDCKLAVISRDDYFVSVGRVQKKQFERLIDFIKECAGFENLAKSSISRLLLFWNKRKYYKN